MKTKQCFKCKQIKNIEEFYKDKSKIDGLTSHCKECYYNYNKSHKIERKKYNEAHKEEILNYFKNDYNINKERYKQNGNEWRKKHNKELNIYYKEKYFKDINYRLNHKMSSSINGSLKGNKQGKHWEDIVGWKLEEGMKHLESQFTLGMSWGNYGEWEIDHIIPISSFNITNYNCDDFKRCWSLDNLQPLWKTTRTINNITYLGNRNKSNLIYSIPI